MNPKIIDIVAALNNIDQRSHSTTIITGTKTFPDWDGLNDHIQGIAMVNGTKAIEGCITGSSSDGAYFATFRAELVRRVQKWPYTSAEDYDHAGGVQLLDYMLPLPIESDKEEDKAKISFWDLSDFTAPRQKYTIDLPGRKSSATAITNFTDGAVEKALLASYEYDPRYMRFYLADYAAVSGSSNPWKETYYYQGTVFDGGDQFQSFSLVTDTANEIHLLGFRGNEELLHFKVESEKNPFSITGITYKRSYTAWDGDYWRYGVGAQIVDSTQIRIYATDKDPSGEPTDYEFKIYHWS
jgi:hypothetical protein